MIRALEPRRLPRTFAAIATALLVAATIQAQVPVIAEFQQLDGLALGGGGGFGGSLALDLLAGVAAIRGGNGVNIFRESGGTWVAEDFLTSPIGSAASIGFGNPAISGNVVVVGAKNASIGCIQCSSGAAFVFRYDGAFWDLEETLTPISQSGARFGEVVAMSGDLLAVGTHSHTVVTAPLSVGSVHLFRDTGPGGWILEGVLTSDMTVTAGYSFAQSVDADGDVVVVGDPGANDLNPLAGAVHVFRRVAGVWEVEAVLGLVGTYRTFGASVSVRGDLLAVGAPRTNGWVGAVHIFRRNGTQWLEEQVIPGDVPSTEFGDHVAVASADTILVGQPADGVTPPILSKVRVYRNVGGAWVETAHLIGSDVTSDSYFANQVVAEGDLVLVGSSNHDNGPGQPTGAAYLFDLGADELRRGDVNGDGGLDIADAIAALGALFVPGTPPLGCVDAADANDDGSHDVADAIYALSALFVPGAPSPPPPFPGCGADPTADALPCATTPGCP